MSYFNEDWLKPGAVVPVDLDTTLALVEEIKRLRDPDRLHAAAEVTARLLGDNAVANEISLLRSIAGKADVGPSFSEMTSELRHQTPSE